MTPSAQEKTNYGSINPSRNEDTIPAYKPASTILSAVVASFAYLCFHFTFAWMTLFALPKSFLPDFLSFVPTLDSADTIPLVPALAVELVLICFFGIFHSLFARRSVKKWMGLPHHSERAFYLLQTCSCLLLIFGNWRNFDAPTIYDVTKVTWLSALIVSVYLFGVVFLVSSTFALDHFSLFGLSQGFGFDFNDSIGLTPVQTRQAENSATPVTRWHYKIVAHPIMTGMLTMTWATPLMTMPRFLYSACFTVYIMIAVHHFEEPDLVVEMGEAYTNYLKTVPRFIPFTKFGGK